MRPQTASITLAAANAAAVAASQTPSGAGALTLVASPVVLDTARRVIVTTTGSDAGKTITLVGTDGRGNAISEVLVLVNNGVTQSAQDFAKVTSATVSAATSALTMGTSATASTRWIVLDYYNPLFNVGLYVNLGGVAVTAAVEVTMDDPNRAYVDSLPNGSNNLATMANSIWTLPAPVVLFGPMALTQDTPVSLTVPVRAVRLTVSSGAATAGVRLTAMQAGV